MALSDKQLERIRELRAKGFGPKDISQVVAGVTYRQVMRAIHPRTKPAVIRDTRQIELLAAARCMLRAGAPESVVRANFGDVL